MIRALTGILLPVFLVSTLLNVPIVAASPIYSDSSAIPTSEKMAAYGCRGCMQVSQGMLNYQYPFKFPDGRNGLSPSVSLQYTQGSENQSIVAPGWNLSYGGSIERSLRKGPKAAATLNEFSITLGGSQKRLLPISLTDTTHGTYGERFEEQQFFYEFLSNDSWRVMDGQGHTYTFGTTATAKQINPNASNATFTWMLEKIEDTNGNSMAFSYLQDSGQIYPKTITYTNRTSEAGNYKVLFQPFASGTLTPRPTAATSFSRGFEVKTRYRLENIQLMVNSISTTQPQKDYVFNYSAQQATDYNQNLLSVTERGWNGSAWESLPPTVFQYDTSSFALLPADVSNYLLPGSGAVDSPQKIVADINNDGLTDVIRDQPGSSEVWLHNGVNGWEAQSGPETNWKIPYGWGEGDGIPADINNDGFLDLIKVGGHPEVWLNNKINGWEFQSNISAWEVPTGWEGSEKLAADINNDGLIDLIRTQNGSQAVYINNGVNGWVENPATNWQLPGGGWTSLSRVVADINADGLPDLIRTENTNEVYIHNGINGWVDQANPDVNWEIPYAWQDGRGLGIATDFNNDGHLDLMTTASTPQFIHNGVNGWNQLTNNLDFNWDPDELRKIFADVDNDGVADALFTGVGARAYVFKGNTNKKYLISVKNPYGGEMKISYKNIKSYRGNNQQLNPKMDANFSVVSETQQLDRGTLIGKSTFSYENGQQLYDSGDSWSYTFVGFETVRTTDLNGNYTIDYYHQGDGINNTAKGEVADHVAKRGRKYRSETYDSSGKLFRTELSRYSVTNLAGGRYSVQLSQKNILDYEGASTPRSTVATYSYDNYGNPTTVTDFGEVTITNSSGDFTDIGTDKTTNRTSYAVSTPASAQLLHFPSLQEKLNNAGAIIARKKVYYDALANGQVSKGNQTREENFKNGSSFVATVTTYNTRGMPETVTNPRGYLSRTTYDSLFLFPATVTNAKNQVTSFIYDSKFGVPVQITDPNGGLIQSVFDTFGRPIEEKIKAPDGSMKTIKQISYDLSAQPISISQTIFSDSLDSLGAPIQITQKTYFDGLNRAIQTISEAEGATNFVTVSKTYDDRGNIKEEFLPKFTTSQNYSVPNPADPKTIATYDTLNRPITSTNSLGTTSIVYTPWQKTVTDSNGKKKDFLNDAHGNLITVNEYLAGVPYSTKYTYDSNNNLTKLTDAEGNIKKLTYTWLGQKLTEELLHKTSNTTPGIYRYTYDANGNLASQTDAKNQVINYTYDQLDRALTENATEAIYTYDSGTNAIGKVSSIVTANLRKDFGYDILGNLIQEKKTIDGIPYITNFTYDLAGNILNLTYPDGTQVTYNYTNAGQINGVKKAGTDVVSNMDYAPTGTPTIIAYANGVTTTNTYDAQKLYRMTRKQTAGPVITPPPTVSTVTFSPAAGDGTVSNSGTVWSTIHDAITGNAANATAVTTDIGSGLSATSTYQISRMFLPFNTSSIPDNATITSAKLKVFVETKLNNDNDGDDFITVVRGTQPSVSTLTTADYDLTGAISNPVQGVDAAERKDITAVTANQYLTFTLNSTGRSWISKTGNSKLALREGHDTKNSAFTGTTAGQFNKLTIRTSEYTGTSSDPILEVTYSVPSTPVSTKLQDISYTYDAVGNITNITDASQTNAAKTATYAYDDLSRLTSATITGAVNGQNYSQTYAYSPTGNIQTRSDVGSYTYGGIHPQAVASAGGITNAYDSNGSLTSSGTWTHAYDLRNRLISSVNGSTSLTYTYDESGSRVKKVIPATAKTTLYINKFYDLEATDQKKSIYIGDLKVATDSTSTGLTYHNADHLTGASIDTNASGNQISLLDYYPYGNTRLEEKTGAYTNDYKYTGKELDEESNLYYYGARYYNATIGRFISQDPWGGDITDPQSFNKYSYVRNNPLKYVDPTGKSWEEFRQAFRQATFSAFTNTADNVIKVVPNTINYTKEFGIATYYGVNTITSAISGDEQNTVSNYNQFAAHTDNMSEVMTKSLDGVLTIATVGVLATGKGAVKGAMESSVGQIPVGRRGNPLNILTKNSPTTINDTLFTGHALDQMQSRGILSPSVVLDVIKNPSQVIPGNLPGRSEFIRDGLSVITNSAHDIIISVITKSSK